MPGNKNVPDGFHRLAGLERGRWALAGCRADGLFEVLRPESSGKTTMALHAVAEAQKLGGTGPHLSMLNSAGSPLTRRPLGDQ